MNKPIVAGRGTELRHFAPVLPGPPARSKAKRLMDLAIAIPALVFLSPLLALISLAVLIESGRPILFRQRRTGLGGVPFRIMKFRTMKVTEDGAVVRQASAKDERVTLVGRFLRKTHWDEFPQLINVVCGDMTLVGPRPHAIAHDLLYQESCPGYHHRFSAKPGLTGLAQVNGHRGEVRNVQNMKRRVEADILYVDQWCLTLDCSIVIRTIPLLFLDKKSF